MTRANPLTLSNHWALALVTTLLVALYAPTITWLYQRWTISVWQNAHGLLLAIFVIYLIRKELKDKAHLPTSSNVWGFVVLIPALLLYMLDAGMHTQLLSAVALILSLPGLALLFLGTERTKAILFPLGFLLFTLPIPLAFTETAHLILRKIATFGAVNIIPHLGISIYAEGTVLHTPRGELMVADACSGFSTLYASVAIACLVAYRCTSPRRRLAVLLAAAPVAILANMIRVSLLVVLVDWQGVEILGTSWHTISGLFTFALALPIIFWLGREPLEPIEHIK